MTGARRVRRPASGASLLAGGRGTRSRASRCADPGGRPGRLGRRPGRVVSARADRRGSVRARSAPDARCGGAPRRASPPVATPRRGPRPTPGEVNAAGTARLPRRSARRAGERRRSGAAGRLDRRRSTACGGAGAPARDRRSSTRRRPTPPARPRPRWRRSRSGAGPGSAWSSRGPSPTPVRASAERSWCPGSSAAPAARGQPSAPAVTTGNLEPVRDLLDVRDVVDGLPGAAGAGRAGEAYNVARGDGLRAGRAVPRLAGPARLPA